MLDTLSVLPISFWVVVAILAWGLSYGYRQIQKGLGLPYLTVLATASTWYVGDAFYNDYAYKYRSMFTDTARDNAWWQVALFLLTYVALTPVINRLINRSYRNRGSEIVHMFQQGTDQPEFQLALQRLLQGCLVIWVVLAAAAVWQLQGESIYYFFPYLSYRANPWSRGRVGGGFDFVLSFASYVQLFISGMFGICLALLRRPGLRFLAFVGCFFCWPFFIFDRTRNVMLAAVLPGILAWVLLRLRLSPIRKVGLLAGFFCIIYIWFAFVIAHRSSSSIVDALNDDGLDVEKNASVHHAGLNMYSELCWINTFIEEGTYEPNWGTRYFAEIVNPIPRTIWPGKPMIGIDYAKLRGQGYDQGGAGVGATISTGMIGQGVVNFGIFIGPPFAALLMSLWTAMLVRLDLSGRGFGRIPLYGLGLILTFNLGRDITLITLYTFIFGWILIWGIERVFGGNRVTQARRQPPQPVVLPEEGMTPARSAPRR